MNAKFTSQPTRTVQRRAPGAGDDFQSTKKKNEADRDPGSAEGGKRGGEKKAGGGRGKRKGGQGEKKAGGGMRKIKVKVGKEGKRES